MLENKYEQIIKDCKKRIAANPRDFFAYYQYARALEMSGETERAIKVFEDAITINPKTRKERFFLSTLETRFQDVIISVS